MIINHNLNSMNAHRNMSFNTTQTGKAMEKLSSGLRINRAGDDAAGLAISEKMRGQIRGLDQATRNSQDGISLIQTAEGALNETHSILQRMRELAVQSSNDTLQPGDRDNIQSEVNELASEITRIADTTEFNKKTLMGSAAQFNGDFQIGANANQTINLKIDKMDAVSLDVGKASSPTAGVKEISVVAGTVGKINTSAVNLTSFTQSQDLDIKFKVLTVGDGSATPGTAEVTINGVKKTLTSSSNAATGPYTLSQSDFRDIFETGNSIVLTPTSALAKDDEVNIKVTGAKPTITGVDVSTSRGAAMGAITTIDTAISKVSKQRSSLGAVQNRLEHTINNLSTSAENLQAAESRIRDVDMAKEMMNFTKNNILNQAAQAMMAQSNQQPQAVLQLLR